MGKASNELNQNRSLVFEEINEEIPTIELKVDTPVTHFADFAVRYGINYKVLKHYNPWLRNHYLTNKTGKEYIIKVPVN